MGRPSDEERAPFLPAGTTVVRQEVFRGRLWTAYPTRLLEHAETRLVLVHWPGVEVLVPTSWIAWLRGAGDAVREEAIPNLARGTWELGRWTWQSTTWANILLPDRWFSLGAVIEDDARAFRGWYVNFERPFQLRGETVETFDLLLDLVVEPDLSHRWKDEGEYRQARRLGVVSDLEARQVERAREEALAMVEALAWPFDQPWTTWLRRAAWDVPALPDDLEPWAGHPR